MRQIRRDKSTDDVALGRLDFWESRFQVCSGALGRIFLKQRALQPWIQACFSFNANLNQI